MKRRILRSLVLLPVLSGTVVCPLSAGEKARPGSVFTDRHGNAGWIETDRAGDRMRATPYLHVSGETVRKATDAAGDAAGPREAAAAMPPDRSGDRTAGTSGQRKEAVAALLSGPDGISLGRVLDLAREAADTARSSLRDFRNGSRDSTTPP